MCLAVPAKIISIDESNPEMKMAKVDFGGVKKDVCVQWIEDLTPGDYVLVHAGFALNKIDEKEALETLRLFREISDLENETG